ncbi:MAG: LON peptidase substrate-binding domain-containing protein [Bdellovibrionaceae bacterium]|nr:LON peptidase substrate-binding domain-containing protein [Pseudobdellovibrionaceae bacterium]
MKVFLFPLGHVLLYPGTSKPLHIFEPRYLKMVQDSIEQRVPIAIGFVDDPQKPLRYEAGQPLGFVRDVVGYGHPQIIETRPDGTLLILLPGNGKAKLGRLLDDSLPYLVCEAEKIEEDMTISNETSPSYVVLQKLLLNWLQNNIPDSRAREEFRRHLKTPEQVVGCVAAYLVADPDMQQMILEENLLEEKINLLSGMIGRGRDT